MKKLILMALLVAGMAISGNAQSDKTQVLRGLENNSQSDQEMVTTATLKSASRLFAEKGDLTSVIVIIPADSIVIVLGSDSTYLNVSFQGTEGFIYRKDAAINPEKVALASVEEPADQSRYQVPQEQQQQQQVQQQEPPQESRFTYLENKYGSSMATKLMAGKIWKGMNSEMVNDSWGTAQKINRVISDNTVKEEWIYRNTWLYFENDILVDWGPVKR
ncbi:MAG TPA: hypothetical protein VJ963_08830 [Bacteroidales bacterium]|nr:hypothetical protein [Bacteroidales bacterium]